jgi:hypothetical protein
MTDFKQTISLYPNPIFYQDLEVRSNKTLEGCTIVVVDLIRKEIRREKIVTVVKEFSLPLKGTKEGVYIVTIINKEGIKLVNEKVVEY